MQLRLKFKFIGSYDDDFISSLQCVGDWFAQWTGRNNFAVAEAICAVDHQKRMGLCQSPVLQAVVHYQDIRTGVHRCLGGRRAIVGDPGWCDIREQERFVADLMSIMPGIIDTHWACETTTIAAR